MHRGEATVVEAKTETHWTAADYLFDMASLLNMAFPVPRAGEDLDRYAQRTVEPRQPQEGGP